MGALVGILQQQLQEQAGDAPQAADPLAQGQPAQAQQPAVAPGDHQRMLAQLQQLAQAGQVPPSAPGAQG